MLAFAELRILLELIYTCVIVLSCVYIVLKTKKLFTLSGHQGIGYFSTAFLYFGYSFLFRFLEIFLDYMRLTNPILPAATMFTLIMGTLIVLYSLFWKMCEGGDTRVSSTFIGMFVVHIVGVIILLLGLYFDTHLFFYGTMIPLSIAGFFVSYYRAKHHSNSLHAVAMFFLAIGLMLNFAYAFYLDAKYMIAVYITTSLLFLLFAKLVHTITHGKKTRKA